MSPPVALATVLNKLPPASDASFKNCPPPESTVAIVSPIPPSTFSAPSLKLSTVTDIA